MRRQTTLDLAAHALDAIDDALVEGVTPSAPPTLPHVGSRVGVELLHVLHGLACAVPLLRFDQADAVAELLEDISADLEAAHDAPGHVEAALHHPEHLLGDPLGRLPGDLLGRARRGRGRSVRHDVRRGGRGHGLRR